MADETDPESKTEDPTPRRREEARRQGRVPFSAELVGSVVLLAGVLGLTYLGGDVWAAMTNVLRHELPAAFRADLGADGTQELLTRTALRVLLALLPFLGILMLVGIASSAAMVGLQFNSEKLEPDFDKLNPANGLGRLFSAAAAVRGLLASLKVLALATIAYIVIERRAGQVFQVGRDSLPAATATGWALMMRTALYLVGAVTAVAVLDYLYQRYKFEQSLRMTKQEVKDELKQEEGDPQIKARIRQIARDRARQKMLAAVPTATVVVTNPTHYAVALRYAPPNDASPVLVAKGAGFFAKRIGELARSHSVPVLERPPLARALYAGVKENQPVPPELFRAVAEVIAFVFRVRGLNPGPNPSAGSATG